MRTNRILPLILVFILLSLTICSGYSQNPIKGNVRELTIRFILQDGFPLSNASIILKPSRVSTVELINTTNHEGYAVFRLDENYFNPIYHPLIKVSYGVYGVIYEKTYNSFNDIPSTIVLPYTVLNTTINVRDEYLDMINGSYTLFYNGHRLAGGEFINGSLNIGGIDAMGLYLLWSTIGSDPNDEYTLTIDVSQGIHKSYKLIDVTDSGIIIDVYPPKLVVEDFNYQYMENAHIMYFYLNISGWDGINTEDLSFNVGMKIIIGNNSIDLMPTLEECTIHGRDGLTIKTCRYKSSFLTRTMDPNTINAVEYSVTAIDPSGKKSTINGYETIRISNGSNGSAGSTNTLTTTPFQSTTPASTTTRHGNQSVGFTPPPSSGGENMFLPYSIYYLGPLLGVIVLFIELRSHHIG